jgi:cell surface protein SprA
MRRVAPIWSARGRASRFVVVCAVWLASAGEERADFVTPWIGGARPWEPDAFRNDFSLVSLTPRLETRLDGSRNVRDEVVVDLESGTIVVRRRYGTTLIGPEWVDDRRIATLAAAQRAARKEWIDQVRRRALNPPMRAGDDQVTIDLPSVMGQQARLNLTGTERITFSGTSNRIDGGPTFESGDPSAFPDLDMKQELSVNLDGTIGEKIHVLVNHDSEVDTDLSNRIKLRYDGDEDEVVQKIEMGNTDLSLPGSEFLSFRKSQQGLF